MLHLWAQSRVKNSNSSFSPTCFKTAEDNGNVPFYTWNQPEGPPCTSTPPLPPPQNLTRGIFFFCFLITGSCSSPRTTFAYFCLSYQVGWHKMYATKSLIISISFLTYLKHDRIIEYEFWMYQKGYFVQLCRRE